MESYYVSLTGIGESEVVKEDLDTSNLKDNEAIIKTEYSMISAGTELSRAFALKQGFKYPVRPGYCLVGRVIEKGKDVKAEIGDLIYTSAPHASLVRFHSDNKTQGHLMMRLDQDIDPKEATIMNLLLVALQGVNLTEVKLGYTVGVFGLGNIGIVTALMYKKLGCKVIGLDIVEKRCELAKSMGVEYVVSSPNQKEKIDKLTNGKGLDISVDVTGVSKVILDCIDNTRSYGQVLLLGSPRVAYECDITPALNKLHMKNLKVLGGFNQTAPVHEVEGSYNSVERNFEIASQLIKNKDIDVSKLISRVVDPKECKEAYYDLMYNKDKANCIIFDWTKY